MQTPLNPDLQPIKNIQILITRQTNTESAYGELFKAPYFTKMRIR
jgi:hypothetical protein